MLEIQKVIMFIKIDTVIPLLKSGDKSLTKNYTHILLKNFNNI